MKNVSNVRNNKNPLTLPAKYLAFKFFIMENMDECSKSKMNTLVFYVQIVWFFDQRNNQPFFVIYGYY